LLNEKVSNKISKRGVVFDSDSGPSGRTYCRIQQLA